MGDRKGRKTFLFVGSDQGGKTAAALFSFTASRQRHGLDPFAYLRHVLYRLAANNPQGEDLAALLPDRWPLLKPRRRRRFIPLRTHPPTT
jgi:transposase